MYYSEYSSPIGKIFLVSDGESLIGSYAEGQKYFLLNFKNLKKCDELQIFIDSKKCLDKYFSGEEVNMSKIKLAPQGTNFQKEVWDILKEIPYSQILTYKDISKIICEKKNIEKMSSQAVGGAISRNPLLIFIPCHRVIGSNGKLTGFAAGIDKKLFLLKLENCKSAIKL